MFNNILLGEVETTNTIVRLVTVSKIDVKNFETISTLNDIQSGKVVIMNTIVRLMTVSKIDLMNFETMIYKMLMRLQRYPIWRGCDNE